MYMIQVFLPSQLESYTEGVRQVELGMSDNSELTLSSVIQKFDERHNFRIDKKNTGTAFFTGLEHSQ